MGSCRNAKKGRVITLDALDIQRYILRVAAHDDELLRNVGRPRRAAAITNACSSRPNRDTEPLLRRTDRVRFPR
jgi:hypothetical protein